MQKAAEPEKAKINKDTPPVAPKVERAAPAEAAPERAEKDVKRALAQPRGAPPHALLVLQRKAGNRAVANLLTPKRAAPPAAMRAPTPTVAPEATAAEPESEAGIALALATPSAGVKALTAAGDTADPPPAGPRGATPLKAASPVSVPAIQRAPAEGNAERRVTEAVELLYYEGRGSKYLSDNTITVLRQAGQRDKTAVNQAFQAKYGLDPRAWLTQNFVQDENFARAIAILRAGHEAGAHVKLAMALLPTQTDEALIMRTLTVDLKSLSQRHFAEREYNATYWGIGKTPQDTLAAHLAKELNDWSDRRDFYKALALLHHDLTPAEELFLLAFDKLGAQGEQAVKYLQDHYKQAGRNGIEKMKADWGIYAQNLSGWAKDAQGAPLKWAEKPLREHLKNALLFSPTNLNLALNVLDGAVVGDLHQDLANDSEGRQRGEEHGQLYAAHASLLDATGLLSWTTDEDQILKATARVREIWQQRLARAKKQKDEKLLAEYTAGWQADQIKLLGRLERLRSRLSGPGQARFRASLIDSPALADQLYEFLNNNVRLYAEAARLITDAWAKGADLGQVEKEALEGKFTTDPATQTRHILRPPYRMSDYVNSSSDLDGRRVWSLFTRGSSAQRGAQRLAVELHEQDRVSQAASALTGSRADGELAGAYSFLKQADKFRNEVIALYLAQQGETTNTPSAALVQRLGRVFERGSNFLNLEKLLTPTRDPQQLAARGRQRQQVLTGTGASAVAKNVMVGTYDALTGGHTYENAERDLQTQEAIARGEKDVIGALGQEREKKTTQDVAESQAEVVESSLQEVAAMQKAAVDIVANIVETAVEAAFSAVTGGMGIAAVYGAMAASLAKTGVSEWLLGSEFQAANGEQLKSAVMAGVQNVLDEVIDLRTKLAGFINVDADPMLRRLMAGEKVLGVSLSHDNVQRLANAIPLLIASVPDGVAGALASLMCDAAFLGQAPTDETIALNMRQIGGGVITKQLAGASLTWKFNPAELYDSMSVSERVKVNTLFKLAVKGYVGLGAKLVAFLNEDTSHLSLEEKIRRALSTMARAGVVSGVKGAASTRGGLRKAQKNLALVEKWKDKVKGSKPWEDFKNDPATQDAYDWFATKHKRQNPAAKPEEIPSYDAWLENPQYRTGYKQMKKLAEAEEAASKAPAASKTDTPPETAASKKAPPKQPTADEVLAALEERYGPT